MGDREGKGRLDERTGSCPASLSESRTDLAGPDMSSSTNKGTMTLASTTTAAMRLPVAVFANQLGGGRRVAGKNVF